MLAPMMLVPTLLANLPPAPFPDIGVGAASPRYIGTSTTIVDETASTFAGIDISAAPPHPKRVVVLGVYHGVAAACTATVNGSASYARVQDATHEFSLHCFQIPNGTTLDIVVSAAASLRKAVSVFVIYPDRHELVDSGTATANTTANATVADMKMIGAHTASSGTLTTPQVGGQMIYAGGQHAVLGAFGVTFTGGASLVVESVDAQLEGVASYTAGYGYILGATAATDLSDVTLAETVTGTKRLVVATFYPPKR